MRALALHADVIVLVSDLWQTTCTAVRSGGEGFVIDSPIYPEELRALPDVLEQAGFPVSGLLATHGDWDHLLARTAFPGAALGCAESTAARLAAELGQAQRELREFDAEHYVEGRPPLQIPSHPPLLQALPVPGRLSLGSGEQERELELHAADGHTPDGAAYWLPWARVLVCGDYLSPVEIPTISTRESVAAYRATLARL
ncbi:MAG: MBL fold metallo-hydrolase, partial [Solirubrobacteraceae bacterium]